MSEGAVWILSPASKKLLLYQAPPTLVSALLYTAVGIAYILFIHILIEHFIIIEL